LIELLNKGIHLNHICNGIFYTNSSLNGILRKIQVLKYSRKKKSPQVAIHSIALHFCLTTFTQHSPTGNGFLRPDCKASMTFISKVLKVLQLNTKNVR